jgi:hypothetical protein
MAGQLLPVIDPDNKEASFYVYILMTLQKRRCTHVASVSLSFISYPLSRICYISYHYTVFLIH